MTSLRSRSPFIIKMMRSFAFCEKGATAIEYGLIAGLIAVAIITAVSSVGTNLTAKFNQVAGNLT